MASISGLYTALSGMNAHRKILDTTAHNVSNQSTPGYRRRVVDLAPSGVGTEAALFAGAASQLNGVDIIGTRRGLDEMAEIRATRERALSSDTATMSATMQQVEAAFPEPSEHGLAAQLGEFWASWSDLADRPTDETARNAVLGRADQLTQTLGRAADELDSIAASATERVGRIADEINELAGRIATLNGSIAANPNSANDDLDARDQLLNRLSELTGSTTRPGVGGQVEVSISGRSLVSGSITHRVTGNGGTIRWERGGDPVNPPSSEAAARMRVIDETIPGLRSQLDGIAATLVNQVNTAHAAGYDLDGNTGWNFFDPAGVTADTIRLSTAVEGQPRRLAAGAPAALGGPPPGPYDGGNADQLAGLADGAATADAEYRSFITALGVATSSAARRADTQRAVADRAVDSAESVSGVSLDEEMVTLIQAQRGYEASARVLTVIDQLLGTLLERTGVVGR